MTELFLESDVFKECGMKLVDVKKLGARLVYVFKNWKLLFKNICRNTCGWKSALKCVKCCLKTKNCCLKSQIKHPLILLENHFGSLCNNWKHPLNRTQPFNVELLQATEHGHNDLAIYIQSIKEENILNWVSR